MVFFKYLIKACVRRRPVLVTSWFSYAYYVYILILSFWSSIISYYHQIACATQLWHTGRFGDTDLHKKFLPASPAQLKCVDNYIMPVARILSCACCMRIAINTYEKMRSVFVSVDVLTPSVWQSRRQDPALLIKTPMYLTLVIIVRLIIPVLKKYLFL